MSQVKRDWSAIAATVLGVLWLGIFPLWQDLSYAHITRAKWLGALALCGATVLVCVVLAAVCFRRMRWHPAQLVAVGYFAWVALSAWQGEWADVLNSENQLVVWMGAIRYEGLLTHLCYALIFLMLSFFPVRLDAVLHAAALALMAFAGVVTLQYQGVNALGLFPAGRSIFTNYEFQGTIGNIDMVSGYLSLVIPLLLGGFATREKGGWLWLAAGFAGVVLEWCMEVQSGIIALMLLCALLVLLAMRKPAYRFRVGVVLTAVAAAFMLRGMVFLPWLDGPKPIVEQPLRLVFGTQAALGLVMTLVLGGFTVLVHRKPGKAMAVRSMAALVVAVVVLAVTCLIYLPIPSTMGGVYELHEILNGRPHDSFGSWRIGAWRCALDMSRDRLLFGNGPDTFYYAFYNHLQTLGVTLGENFDNPHNEYVAILANNGLPALVLYLGLLFWLMAACIRRKCWPLALAIVCFAVQGHFSFSICLVTPMFWAVLGMAAALCGKALPRREKRAIIESEVNEHGS